ncbi:hypothetical protein [Myroides sp. LJL119]
MRNILVVLFIAFASLLNSCGTKNDNKLDYHVILDTDQTAEDKEFRIISSNRIATLNKAIKEKSLRNEADIMQEYSPEDRSPKDNYLYVLRKKIGPDPVNITISLLEDQINNPAIKAKKVIMDLTKDGENFKVTKIKESYQCRENRGQQEWGAELCI